MSSRDDIKELLKQWSKERDPKIMAVIEDAVLEDTSTQCNECGKSPQAHDSALTDWNIGHDFISPLRAWLDDQLKQIDWQIEADQIREVIGEELEPKPWVVGEPGGERYRHGYWYDFAPEWVTTELEREYGWGAKFRTIVTSGGGYQQLEDDDGIWVLVREFNHGAERECPLRTWDEVKNEDSRDGVVVLENTYYGLHPGESCRFCEEKIGEEHGYIYIGEGAEYVYVNIEEDEEEGEE